MVYRPRYLDSKRNKPKKTHPFLVNTRIEQGKCIMDYSKGYRFIITKERVECFDSNGKLKWWVGEEGIGEIFE